MVGRSNAVTVAAVSACTTIVVYEILRRLAAWAWGDEELFRVVKKEDEDEELPELGKSLREKEYSFPDSFHPMNNGSYGAVPQRVLNAQISLMKEREENPENWCRFRRLGMYKNAVRNVAEFVGAKPENLVLVENVTVATNSIVKSFKFQDGDKVLVTNHTYGAVLKTMELVINFNEGVSLVPIDIPVQTTSQEIVDLHRRALDDNPRIRVALIDHITSFSAIVLPIKELIEVCHSRGVIVAIDAAHAPGQLPLNLEELGADFYYGNLHKWLFAPRGCALLYVHPKHHSWIRTAISSHSTFDEDLNDRFHYIGTRDSTPYYVAKNAIQYHNYLGGLARITAYNTKLAYWAADMLAKAWSTTWIQLEESLRAPFMCLIVLPQTQELAQYKTIPDLCHEIAKRHGIAVAITTDGKQKFLRVSAQVYNYEEEFYLLRDAIIDVLGIEK